MSAVFEAVRDKPLALFPLDGDSPFVDYSGYNQTATASGTTKSTPLCAGVSSSTVFNKDAIGKFSSPTPGFKQGNESIPFSLESWVYPIHRALENNAPPYHENLFTNPGFESKSATKTLYTNLAANPLPANANGTGTANGATVAYDSANAGMHVTVASGGTSDAGLAFSAMLPAVVSGNTYNYSVEVQAIIAGTIKVSIQSSYGGNTTAVTSFNAGEVKRLSITATFTGNGNISAYVLRGNTNASEFIVRKIMVTQTVRTIDYFDGINKTGSWNDSDYTVAWLGTPNGSASVVQAVGVIGVTDGAGKTLSSTQWNNGGTSSLRVLGSASSNDSYARISIVDMVQPGKTYTVFATLRQNAVLTGPVQGSVQQRNITLAIAGGGGVYRGFGNTDPQANAVGYYEHRMTFTVPNVEGDPVTSLEVRLYNGYLIGNDVWWDNLALIEGDYSGPYFDGSVPGYEWADAANASISRTRNDISLINLPANPSGKTTTAGWSHWSDGAGTNNHDPNLGFYSTVTTAGTTNAYTQRYGSSKDSYIPVEPNTTYYMAFDVMSTVDDYRAPFVSLFNYSLAAPTSLYGSNGVLQSGGTPVNIHLPANVWQRVEFNFTTAVDTNFISVGLSAGSGNGGTPIIRPVGSSLYQRNLMVSPSTSTHVTYFDGSFPGAEWSGSANNSWSYMLVTNGDVQILGNNGLMDGLVIDGTEVSFVTKYISSGECRVTYDLQRLRRFHAIGVHTKEKNSLYIDGVLVGEAGLTDEQKKDTYLAGDGFLYSGNTSSSTELAVNSVAIYGTALPEDSPARHFAVGNKHMLKDSMGNGFKGVRFPLVQNEADVFLEQTWTTKKDWQAATLVDVVIEDEKVKPRLVNGTSIAGRWQGLFVMSITDLDSIYGVQFDWDGEGATIIASLDGLYWETVERGKNLDIIPPGFNPKDKELFLRITFPGGIEDDPSYVDNLTVTGFKTGVIPPIHSRNITFVAPAYTRNDHEPVEYSEDWGTRLKGGSAVIESDTTSDDPLVPATIEVWLKMNSTDAFYIDGRTDANDVTNFVLQAGYDQFDISNATAYINGLPVTTQFLPVGEWILVHIVPTVANMNSLYFNTAVDGSSPGVTTGDITIGQVTLYESALTQSDISAIYSSYTGLPIVPIEEENLMQIAEEDPSFMLVAADWTIVAAG